MGIKNHEGTICDVGSISFCCSCILYCYFMDTTMMTMTAKIMMMIMTMMMTTTMIASMTTTKTTTTVVLTIAVVWCAPSSTISSNRWWPMRVDIKSSYWWVHCRHVVLICYQLELMLMYVAPPAIPIHSDNLFLRPPTYLTVYHTICVSQSILRRRGQDFGIDGNPRSIILVQQRQQQHWYGQN